MLQSLQKAFALARKSNATGIPVNELVELERIHSINRKNFIKQSAFATVAIGASGLLDSCKKENPLNDGLKHDVKLELLAQALPVYMRLIF